MNTRKILIALFITSLGITSVSLLWKLPLFLIIVLILLALLKHKLSLIKKELILYILSGIIATITESLIMSSGAWFYQSPQIVNFPIWLPFLWGLAGTTGITLYEGLIGKK